MTMKERNTKIAGTLLGLAVVSWLYVKLFPKGLTGVGEVISTTLLIAFVWASYDNDRLKLPTSLHPLISLFVLGILLGSLLMGLKFLGLDIVLANLFMIFILSSMTSEDTPAIATKHESESASVPPGGRYGTNRDLSFEDVKGIVDRCREWQARGGKVPDFYHDHAPEDGAPGSYSLETLRGWLSDEKFED